MRDRGIRGIGLALLALCCLGHVAQAQTKGCRLTEFTDPPRTVLDCADGLSVTAEKGASYRLVDDDGDGRPEAVALESKAVLVTVPANRRGGFQVRTPHAIASVRGTTWAVDSAAGSSAVFVQVGTVSVTRATASGPAVVLRAGDGVDVAAGDAPLSVKAWSRERRLHLLARFGR